MLYNQFFIKSALPKAEFKVIDSTVDKFFDNAEIESFCIDSRKINKNQFFVALEGERVDGHSFLEAVLKKGITGFLINKKKLELLNNIKSDLLKGCLFIIVEDTLHALTELAKYWRQRFTYPIVGITGSVGKTTTKEILSNIFKVAEVPALISFKNQNTVIGLSLNILKMRNYHKVAAFEMGISHAGEMRELADVLRPTIGVITYISPAHTHGLGSLENVAKEKQQIFSFFNQNDVGIVCGDKEIISNFYHTFPVITFGQRTKNNIQARMIKRTKESVGCPCLTDFETSFYLKLHSEKFKIRLTGNHISLINNSLAAASVANLLFVDSKFIVKGIESYKSFEARFEKRALTKQKGLLINDCYNASPESMKAAIKAFSYMKCDGKKIAVLGDMLELGEKSKFWHRQIGRFLSRSLDIDHVILVGKNAHFVAKTAPVILQTSIVKDWKEAKELLNNLLNDNSNGALILFKASRGVGLDNIVKELS